MGGLGRNRLEDYATLCGKRLDAEGGVLSCHIWKNTSKKASKICSNKQTTWKTPITFLSGRKGKKR